MERLWSQACEQSRGSLVCSSFTGPFISVFAPTCCPSAALGAAVCEWKHCAHGVFPPSALEAPAASLCSTGQHRPSLLVLQPTERLCGLCLLVPKHELARKEGSPSFQTRKARPSYNPGSLRQTKSRARAHLEFLCGDIEVRCVGLTY